MSIDRRALPRLDAWQSLVAWTGAQPNLENLGNPACKSKQDSQDLHDEQEKRVYFILKIEAGL